jgi:hypothetical protein
MHGGKMGPSGILKIAFLAGISACQLAGDRGRRGVALSLACWPCHVGGNGRAGLVLN